MRTFSGTYELQNMLTRGGNPSGTHHKLFVHNEGVYLFSYGIPVAFLPNPRRVQDTDAYLDPNWDCSDTTKKYVARFLEVGSVAEVRDRITKGSIRCTPLKK